jgi:flavorubredoxin
VGHLLSCTRAAHHAASSPLPYVSVRAVFRPCRDFKNQAVKGGDKIDLGGGHVMEFVMAPNLHQNSTYLVLRDSAGVLCRCF